MGQAPPPPIEWPLSMNRLDRHNYMLTSGMLDRVLSTELLWTRTLIRRSQTSTPMYPFITQPIMWQTMGTPYYSWCIPTAGLSSLFTYVLKSTLHTSFLLKGNHLGNERDFTAEEDIREINNHCSCDNCRPHCISKHSFCILLPSD